MRIMLGVDFLVWNALTVFNGWNWFLAFRGLTTLEFLTEMKGAYTNPLVKGFKTFSDNLFLVFGTHKVLRILSPSLRNNAFTGLEWSFLVKDNGFGCDADEPAATQDMLDKNESILKAMYPPGS